MSGPHGPPRNRLLPERRRRARLPGGVAAHPDPAHRHRDRVRVPDRGRLHGRARPGQPRRGRPERAGLSSPGPAAVCPDRGRGGPLRRGELSPVLRRPRRPCRVSLPDDRRRRARPLRRVPAAHGAHGHVPAVSRSRHRPRDGTGAARHRHPLRCQRPGCCDRRPARAVGARALPGHGGGRPRGGRRESPGRGRRPRRRPPGGGGGAPRGGAAPAAPRHPRRAPSARGPCSTPCPASSPCRSRSSGSG